MRQKRTERSFPLCLHPSSSISLSFGFSLSMTARKSFASCLYIHSFILSLSLFARPHALSLQYIHLHLHALYLHRVTCISLYMPGYIHRSILINRDREPPLGGRRTERRKRKRKKRSLWRRSALLGEIVDKESTSSASVVTSCD